MLLVGEGKATDKHVISIIVDNKEADLEGSIGNFSEYFGVFSRVSLQAVPKSSKPYLQAGFRTFLQNLSL